MPTEDDAKSSSPKKVLIETLSEYFDVNPFQLAGALSYFTLLSLAPLLLVLTGLTGLLMSEVSIRGEFIEQTRNLIGGEGAALLQTVAGNLGDWGGGLLTMLTGAALAVIGATTVFAQLQAALNRIWEVAPDPSNAVVGFLRTRLTSLAIVLGLGFLLLVSLVLSATLATLSERIAGLLPEIDIVWLIIDGVVSLAIYTLLIAVLFRYVPDAIVEWRDAFAGGMVTAVLFSVGKLLIGTYLGQAAIGSTYGAAGSAVIFMVWVFYASLMLFFGATLARVLATARGERPPPTRHARPVVV